MKDFKYNFCYVQVDFYRKNVNNFILDLILTDVVTYFHGNCTMISYSFSSRRDIGSIKIVSVILLLSKEI